jgi:hypothetical protein
MRDWLEMHPVTCIFKEKIQVDQSCIHVHQTQIHNSAITRGWTTHGGVNYAGHRLSKASHGLPFDESLPLLRHRKVLGSKVYSSL